MTTIQAPLGARRFQLSRIAELTFDVVRRDFVLVYAVAVVTSLIPAMLTGSMSVHVSGVGAPVSGAGASANPYQPLLPFLAVIGAIFSLFAYSVLSWAGIERLQGRTPSARGMLTVGSAALPTVIGLGILANLGIVAGCILLVVPGFILMTVWFLIVPVATYERQGVFTSFSRSAELTRGHRWSIFLLLIVFGLMAIIISLLSAAVIHAVLGLSGSIFFARPTGPLAFVVLILQALVAALVRTVGGVGVGVAYHELSGLKGGFDARRLSEVFA